MYDLIGDIHGHADELVQLLEMMGYRKIGGTYQHPERKAIFLGDYVDRGPKIRQVLEIVRAMVSDGKALALMGNHELNTLGFYLENPHWKGVYVRERNIKNIRMHAPTLLQLTDEELRSAMEWMRTLPLWLDLDGLRAVHACWDAQANAAIAKALRQHGGPTCDFFRSALMPDSPLFAPMEVALKGKEFEPPHGVTITDKEGHIRSEARVRWFESPIGKTYRTYAFERQPIDCDLELDASTIVQAAPYPPTDKPVFVGHYWLQSERPELLADNVACLDYSVAKGGFLCAYQWHGEQKLDRNHFLWTTRRA